MCLIYNSINYRRKVRWAKSRSKIRTPVFSRTSGAIVVMIGEERKMAVHGKDSPDKT